MPDEKQGPSTGSGETVEGLTVDIGDGRGPQPLYAIPDDLGPYDTTWKFDWRTSKDGFVTLTIDVALPNVGTMTHHARVPFSVEHSTADVHLNVTETTIRWDDYQIGMAAIRQTEQLDQLNRQLQCPEMLGYLPFLPTARLATKRTGRRGKRAIEYAHLARQYVELVEQGDRSPNKTLADKLYVSRKQAENLIFQCRERGYLTDPPKKGVAGGKLTPLCIQTLEENPAPKGDDQ